MTLYLPFICFIFFGISIHAQSHDDLDVALEELYKNDINTRGEECRKYFDGSMTKIVLMVTGAWKGQGRDASQIKCWAACLMQNMGVLSPQTNQVKQDAIYQRISDMESNTKQQLTETVQECVAITEREANACEKSYKYIKCVHSVMKRKTKESKGSTTTTAAPSATYTTTTTARSPPFEPSPYPPTQTWPPPSSETEPMMPVDEMAELQA